MKMEKCNKKCPVDLSCRSLCTIVGLSQDDIVIMVLLHCSQVHTCTCDIIFWLIAAYIKDVSVCI